jgi:SAM-dependent methyltransferase
LQLNQEVRSYWEKEPCGTDEGIVGKLTPLSLEWFEQIESHRYTVEPFIHSAAQFTRHHGKTMLEVGVGAGTDHLQWARAGCICHGVDLTDAAIETTRARFAHYGLQSTLQRFDAETLPYPDAMFDLVYSWGVIHHSADPDSIIAEIHRVLKPGGRFIGMVYGRRSPAVFKLWIRHGLLRGRPWRSFSDIVWNHVESRGTKAYTTVELELLLNTFGSCTVRPLMTSYDLISWPAWIGRLFSERWGWFITFDASK